MERPENGIEFTRKKARLSLCAFLEEYLTKSKNGFLATEIRFLLSKKSQNTMTMHFFHKNVCKVWTNMLY